MKRLVTILLSVSIIFSTSLGVFAQPIDTSESQTTFAGDSIGSIVSSFNNQIERVKLINKISENKNVVLLDAIRNARDEALISAGYDVYRVNSETFSQIENQLNTNFEDIGLDSQSSYLIVLGGETNDLVTLNNNSESIESVIMGPATPGQPFNYTYNGTTYMLRCLYVTADDDEADPGYAQASTVNVLSSNSITLINNCLNTIVSSYISSISKSLGTVMSICGLQLFNFGTTQSSTLNLNGGTNWSRTYTQVYSNYDQAWYYCSCVEYVNTLSFMSGIYYNASLNQMVAVPGSSTTATMYSSYFYDNTWRNTQACYAFVNGLPCIYNKTGTVRYKYGTVIKITHYENF